MIALKLYRGLNQVIYHYSILSGLIAFLVKLECLLDMQLSSLIFLMVQVLLRKKFLVVTVQCCILLFLFPFILLIFSYISMVLQGVAMPAMNNILSKWIPVSERSRSLALVYSGMYLGSVTGLSLSPLLISRFGWPSVFYAFGSLGTVWFALWQSKVRPNLALISYFVSHILCSIWVYLVNIC
jgi:predicted MFS family arabinose efflux permease